jgi:hypothetical protein
VTKVLTALALDFPFVFKLALPFVVGVSVILCFVNSRIVEYFCGPVEIHLGASFRTPYPMVPLGVGA